jgi:hypothetical protein
MAGALFFICMFVITVCGLLLFRPIQVNSITNYSKPAAFEKRKSVTLKMAEFLEKNPQIVKQERFTTLPITDHSSEETASIPPSTSIHQIPDFQVEIFFQGSSLQFKSMTEFDQWIYKNVTQEPLGFLKQLQENNNPELFLDTLKKVSEINSTEPVIEQVKNTYLNEARNLSHIKDGFHQQMMQKALQQYLDLEKDKVLGKKNADEILETSH